MGKLLKKNRMKRVDGKMRLGGVLSLGRIVNFFAGRDL
jgi:hypothetical protein